MKTLHNMKFQVNSPEYSEEIQQELFRLGYYWEINDKEVDETNKPYLFANFPYITWHNRYDHYKASSNTETTLEELKAM